MWIYYYYYYYYYYFMRILSSHVLYILLPGHHPETCGKKKLGYEAIGATYTFINK